VVEAARLDQHSAQSRPRQRHPRRDRALFRLHETLVEIAARPLTAELLKRLYNHARLLECCATPARRARRRNGPRDAAHSGC